MYPGNREDVCLCLFPLGAMKFPSRPVSPFGANTPGAFSLLPEPHQFRFSIWVRSLFFTPLGGGRVPIRQPLLIPLPLSCSPRSSPSLLSFGL